MLNINGSTDTDLAAAEIRESSAEPLSVLGKIIDDAEAAGFLVEIRRDSGAPYLSVSKSWGLTEEG